MIDDDSTPAQASTVVNDETAGNGTETTRKVLLHETITQSIIDSFFAVYNKLDFGFLENVYCGALSVDYGVAATECHVKWQCLCYTTE